MPIGLGSITLRLDDQEQSKLQGDFSIGGNRLWHSFVGNRSGKSKVYNGK
jgi:hypothetical protein